MRITAAGADRILYFQSLFKERKLSAYSHYTSRQTDNQSYPFVPKQVCENLTGNRGDKNNINQRNLLHITNFQRGCNSEKRRRTQRKSQQLAYRSGRPPLHQRGPVVMYCCASLFSVTSAVTRCLIRRSFFFSDTY